MSKWVATFKNHQFHQSWENAKQSLENIDQTEITDENQLIELARLYKVIEYIDSYLKLIDPEVNNANISGNLNHMNSYATNVQAELGRYHSTKNFGHLQNANAHVDNILGQLRGISILLPKTTAQSIAGMLRKYNNVIEKALQEIDLTTAISNSEQIKHLQQELLVDNDEQKSIKNQIENAHTDIESKYEKIKTFYNDILNDQEYDDTYKELIEKAKDEVLEANKTAKEELTELSNKIQNFEEYYVKIFGELQEDGSRIGGLKKEVETQKTKLDQFESAQQKRHEDILNTKLDELNTFLKESQLHTKNLYAQIESLLPGATSAGLAKAYHDEREKFKKPIKHWNIVFIVSLIIMFIATFLSFITFTSTEQGTTVLSFAQVHDYKDTLNNLLYKLPLYGPLIWLAIYASKRRSENQRLEQEYAHKEAFASSYSGYKQQIEELNQEDKELLMKLLESSIDTVSKNASETLDKKHGDKMPSHEILEKFSDIAKQFQGKGTD